MVKKKNLNFVVLKTPKTNVLKFSDHQNGKVKSLVRDKSRKAGAPGKRLSKNGKIYYEYRKNRTDMPLKDV